jgi:hypothetical protein
MTGLRGVTLVEAILYVSVALGLIVGGLVFYQQTASAARVSDQVRQFSSQFSEIASLYRSSSWKVGTSETRAINDVLIGSGAISPDLNAGPMSVSARSGYLEALPNNEANTTTIWTAWRTPSFWTSATNSVLLESTLAFWNEQLARDPGNLSYQNIVSALTSSMAESALQLRYTVLDIPKRDCARLLNAIMSAPLSGNEPDSITGPGAARFAPNFKPSDISSFCEQIYTSETPYFSIQWNAKKF